MGTPRPRLRNVLPTTTYTSFEAALFFVKLGFMERHYETKNGYTVRCIYLRTTDDQRAIAAANFRRYILIASEIQRELEVKPETFDTVPDFTTMKERSNADLKT